MKKKSLYISFVAVCMIICLIPFACMSFAATNSTTENKRLAEFPSLMKDGKINMQMPEQMGKYFEDHFAFRQQLVSADAEIQSRLFGVSNVDTVIKGTDGWLYYTATADDYSGKTLSSRSIRNIAHNISLVQNYVEESGAKFLFTVPPNKNSLYGDNMPYYYKTKAGIGSNCELLKPVLTENSIRYLDLFELFRQQKETLYLKRDSHWNNKGALLAYNAMLDSMDKEHEDYSSAKASRSQSEYGDLNKMLYPLTAQPEWNYYYDIDQQYGYVSDTNSVEDAWIETACEANEDSLLMYRDSFGNTLLPFMANAFESGYFSKATPYDLATDIAVYSPDYVIIEKVERNISDFAEDPPVIPAQETVLNADAQQAEASADITVAESDVNMMYWEISGNIENGSDDTNIYLMLETADSTAVYDVFYTTTDKSDFGFKAFVPADALTGKGAVASIITENGDKYEIVCQSTLAI